MNQLISNYAELIIKIGANVQVNQRVVIFASVRAHEFVEQLTKFAYDAKAKEVQIIWHDEKTNRLRGLYASDEVFDIFPKWREVLYNDFTDGQTTIIHIDDEDPDASKGVDPKRLIRQQKASFEPLKNYRLKVMGNEIAWCIAAIPSIAWAKKVSPNLDDQEAIKHLWQMIFKATRADAVDPVDSWKIHQEQLKQRCQFMNQHQFKQLRYSNALGTNLTIDLPFNHQWQGGSSTTPKGQSFIANMPTEEIFTLPKKDGVNGRVVSSMPLSYNGQLIESFTIDFKNGKAVSVCAEKGEAVLKEMIRADEGAAHLGEVALVPYHSPISLMNTLFYNTLFDENASCHLAFGEAYPTFSDVDDIDETEMIKRGKNKSLIHVDFMIGTSDLNIEGIKQDGSIISVFSNGNFSFEQ